MQVICSGPEERRGEFRGSWQGGREGLHEMEMWREMDRTSGKGKKLGWVRAAAETSLG